MFVIADLKAVQPFPFYQRMKGFDTGIIPRKSFLGIASIHFCCCLFIFFRYILAASGECPKVCVNLQTDVR